MGIDRGKFITIPLSMEVIMFNRPMFAASLIMGCAAFIHFFAGGLEIYDPLRSSSQDMLVISVLSVVWHFVSVQLVLMALALYHLARHPNRALFVFLLATQIGFTLLFLGYGTVDMGSLMPMPQWTIFLAVALLMVWGRPRTL